jgi:hypothetical protein
MGLVLHAIGTGWLLADALRRVRAAVESFDPELPWFDATEVRWGMPVSLYALGAWETNDLPAGA